MPAVCQGYTTCNPNSILVGDIVTIDLCIENQSVRPMAGAPPYPLVAATLSSTAQIEVFLMCRESQCSTAPLSGSLAYTTFVPAAGTNSSFALGATPNCNDALACGLLSLGADVSLPASASQGTWAHRACDLCIALPPAHCRGTSLPLLTADLAASANVPCSISGERSLSRHHRDHRHSATCWHQWWIVLRPSQHGFR